VNKWKSKLLFKTCLPTLLLLMIASVAFAQFGIPMNMYRGGLDGRTSIYNGVAAPVGSIVEIYDQDGIFCGRDTVTAELGAGRYGTVAILGDDLKTGEDEGPIANETLIFELNGRPTSTTGPDEPIWDGNWLPYKEVNLSAEGTVSALFDGPDGQTANSGQTVHYSIIVENNGNGIDFYTLSAVSNNGWIVNFDGSFYYAWPGEIISIDFELVIPPNAPEMTDQIEFSVVSGLDNLVSFNGNVLTSVSEVTDIEDDGNTTIPGDFKLYQNYPNPFNPQTTIIFDLPKSTVVNLLIYDLLGRTVDEIFLGQISAGSHTVNFDAGTLSSGVYFYKIQTDDFSAVKRMVILK